MVTALRGRDIKFSTLTHPDDVERIGERVKLSIGTTLTTGQPAPCNVEMRLLTASGSFLWCDTKFCFCGSRFYAVFRDISAAKKAEVRGASDTHTQARGALLRTDAACMSNATQPSTSRWADVRAWLCLSLRQRCLHDFLATTSHDARTPLSSIAVASQLLRDGGSVRLSDDASELLAAISASNRVLLTSALHARKHAV